MNVVSDQKKNTSNRKNTQSHRRLKAVQYPRKSVVQIYFYDRNVTLSYYNDLFDLQVGDYVYVDGKLEGLLGQVTQVNYSFKIKVSDYKRVVAQVNTDVSGRFFMMPSHFITFEVATLPPSQVLRWLKGPDAQEEAFVVGRDDFRFPLAELKEMKISSAVAERGHDYYMKNRVRYLALDGIRGYALVEGSETYEVEFLLEDGFVRDLFCSCFCSDTCKHQFAVMLQLKEILEYIEKNYAAEFAASGRFAVIDKPTLFRFAVHGKEKKSFLL